MHEKSPARIFFSPSNVKNRKERRAGMSRKEHLLLYTPEAAVLPKVINSLRPEQQEIHRALGSSWPGMQANHYGVQASLGHTCKMQLLQEFVFLLSTGTESLVPGLILRRVRETLCRILASARYYYKYHPLVPYLTSSLIDSFIQQIFTNTYIPVSMQNTEVKKTKEGVMQ